MATEHKDFAKLIAAEISERLATDIRAGVWTPPAEWLTPEGACAYLGGNLTPAGLETMRKEKRGPRYTRPSHKIVRYRRADLDAYMEAHLIDPADRG